MNQHNNILIEDRDARCEQLKPDWCSNQGVTEAQCVSFSTLKYRRQSNWTDKFQNRKPIAARLAQALGRRAHKSENFNGLTTWWGSW